MTMAILSGSWLRHASATAALLGVLTVSIGDAAAQQASTDAAELFEQGRAALAAKDYRTACTKFEASLTLERAVGTLISLATCEEGLNKLASARQHWQEAEELANATHDRFGRASYAHKHVTELNDRVPIVTITIAGGDASSSSNIQVQRDGINLPSFALGAPLRVDPGPHTFTVSAPSRKTKSRTIQLQEGEQRSVALELGEPIATLDPRDAEKKPSSPSGPPSPSSEPTTGGGTPRPLGYAAGGVGVAALGVGIVTGLVASSKWSDAKSACGVGCTPDSTAYETRDGAQTFATISTVSFIIAGVGLATAAVLILTAPRRQSTTTTAGAVVDPKQARRSIHLHPAGASFVW